MLTSTQLACEQLVKHMETNLGRPLQSEVRQAFLHVPRHCFIEGYYRQQGKRLKWDYIAEPNMEELYQDEPLVTRIDERGYPICSSSLPSVMAQQLEALQLQGGQRVLEIGTGTGYNAALLRELVQPFGQVISLEIDESLVTSAGLHLSSVGMADVVVCKRNGAWGEGNYAPYDRLLATCGVKTLPRPWIEQLKRDGLLIVNILLNLTSLFLRLKKVSRARLEGQFLAIDAIYMEMHGPQGVAPYIPVDWASYYSQPHREVDLTGNLSELLEQPAFAVFLQSRLPTLERHPRWNYKKQQPDLYLLDRATDSVALVKETSLIQYGHHCLTEQIQQSLQIYKELGSPGLDLYQIFVDESPHAAINGVSLSLPFALSSS
jgi:protein-L-isoaspartate(D-aspartate) O-methyltransferase